MYNQCNQPNGMDKIDKRVITETCIFFPISGILSFYSTKDKDNLYLDIHKIVNINSNLSIYLKERTIFCCKVVHGKLVLNMLDYST